MPEEHPYLCLDTKGERDKGGQKELTRPTSRGRKGGGAKRKNVKIAGWS